MKNPAAIFVTNNAHLQHDKTLSEFLERLYREKGWDFRDYKKTSIKRRIAVRLSAHNISSYDDYSKILTSNPSEYEKLFSTLTVKVSEFFREPDVFDILKEIIISKFSDTEERRFTGEELRIWCCGCAYGEEAYSMAILLNESLKLSSSKNIRIFATDIDNESIEIARKGVYKEDVLQNISQLTRDRYFMKTDKGFKTKYSIRDMVKFGNLNIVTNSPLSRIDILFCRNLLMYFEKSLQKAAFEKIDFALKPGGILVLGKAEIIPSSFLEHYTEIKKRARVYIKEGGSA